MFDVPADTLRKKIAKTPSLPQGAVKEDGRQRWFSLTEINELRRRLKFRGKTLLPERPADRAIRVAISNFKGGVGKTVVAQHFANAAALDGYRVLVIDFDPQATMTHSMGLTEIKEEQTVWGIMCRDLCHEADRIMQSYDDPDDRPWGAATPRKNRFGFGDLEQEPTPLKRERGTGPMSAAVKDAAASLQMTTEVKVEQRRQNAFDAKAYRKAQEEGRVLVKIGLEEVLTDDLPRDRIDLSSAAVSDEIELESSIRLRGQREPIEVYVDHKEQYQLITGWRRLHALRQLLAETSEDRFSTVTARVSAKQEERVNRYIDMVEENAVREDLTFADMASVAIAAAEDKNIEESDPDALVAKLYSSLHKVKRSYIRSFIYLLLSLGDELKWPTAVARNLGVDCSRRLKEAPEALEELREALSNTQSPEEQNRVLADFSAKRQVKKKRSSPKPREKYEFHVSNLKVTARNGECRIVGKVDYASLPREQLEKAVKAFEEVLKS